MSGYAWSRRHSPSVFCVALKLVWLERGHPRASAVADVLSAAGFPDLGGSVVISAIIHAKRFSP
ncbi:hypothetical protein AB295_22695 [Salmonella enterica]|uniref:Uncharacterized protein n=1 Tax=Salmonella enterica subsp. enterica serovar Rubislaw str. ATCC 10717 TaxID=938143 RepID=A0A6W0P254_SALRU|nr:hypothetical protein SEERU717_23200 [Salmonella enterica subsp. enterica serovar Rubislaw str. ATCC 10717]EAY7303958.1 hypothetical protein [Salmonella enterica]EBY1811035.1 hypothetical protein [Salmonella enterica subsp. enterica serovar Rubislaw]EDJ9214978.1 hypothetical protein [Salmonella enterica subsp. enterica serovar Bareilly]HAE7715019.1 hypothetical protein [Salmonella enterica subsp. enterica]